MPRPNHGEIAAIQRKHDLFPQPFTNGDDRRINQAEAAPIINFHQHQSAVS